MSNISGPERNRSAGDSSKIGLDPSVKTLKTEVSGILFDTDLIIEEVGKKGKKDSSGGEVGKPVLEAPAKDSSHYSAEASKAAAEQMSIDPEGFKSRAKEAGVDDVSFETFEKVLKEETKGSELEGIDPMLAFMALKDKLLGEGVRSASEGAQARINQQKKATEARSKKILEAGQKKEKSGFWGKIATVAKWVAAVASIVAATAAVVVSGGAAAPLLAAAIIGVALMIDSATGGHAMNALGSGASKVLQGMGMDKDSADKWGKVAANVAVVAVQIGLIIASAGMSAPQAGQTIVQMSDKAIMAANAAKTAGQVASSASSVAGGVSSGVQAGYEYSAIQTQADATQIKAMLEKLKQYFDDDSEFMKALVKAQQDNVESATDMVASDASSKAQVTKGTSGV